MTEPLRKIVHDFRREAGEGGGRVVVGAFLGSAMGVTSIPFYTLGLFAAPLRAEFGWSVGAVQASLSFSMLGLVIGAAPTGWLCDRIGVRRVAIGALLAMAMSFVLLAAAGPKLWVWYLSWTVMSALGSGTTAVTWTRGLAG